MKKLYLYTAFLSFGFSFYSCAQQKNVQNEKSIQNKIVVENGKNILIGEFNRKALEEIDFEKWFDEEYNSYEIEQNKLTGIENLKNYTIEIFLGTWCPDSRREIPRLLKILDQEKFPASQLHLIAVNHKKKSNNGEEVGKNVSHVPTIIVYDKNKKEVGRIVESPVSAYLEEDLAQIVKGTPLKPNYSND